jgi:hypothetical protein
MPRKQLPALEVHQWLDTWKHATWGAEGAKPTPPKSFFVASIPIGVLRALAGIPTRTKEARRQKSSSAGYQRSHEEERSAKISRYLEFGYPLSTAASLKAEDHPELINPGWLPTAILVSAVGRSQSRPRGRATLKVKEQNLVKVIRTRGAALIDLPINITIDPLKELAPLEIIDGQHRLLSVDSLEEAPVDYELPVVIFEDLDPTWQAYLFWVINVEPKKINPSLAFDLYPELRNQDWLERGEAIKIYQEHRSQELAEVLWRHPKSPWHERVELFGNRVEGHISNAAVIRTLAATFVRSWPRGVSSQDEFTRIGGLFGSLGRQNSDSFVIGWQRSQQAAFLIHVWRQMQDAVASCTASWAKSLRKKSESREDPAFTGAHTLLATDQGFRAVCFAFNAVTQLVFEELELPEWYTTSSEPTDKAVDQCLQELSKRRKISGFLHSVAVALANSVDWRTSAAVDLSDVERQRQSQYRGSSGYSALNRAAILGIKTSRDALAKSAATQVMALMERQHG